jgi:hypothetical protein
MAKITIVDVTEFAGEYELDLKERPFTGWDAHIIYKIAGVGLAELDAAADAGNYDLVIALTVIALVRAEQITRVQAMRAAEVLLEAELGKIIYTKDETPETDALPPVSEPDSISGDANSNGHSGSDSERAGDLQEIRTGDHGASTPPLSGEPG